MTLEASAVVKSHIPSKSKAPSKWFSSQSHLTALRCTFSVAVHQEQSQPTSRWLKSQRTSGPISLGKIPVSLPQPCPAPPALVLSANGRTLSCFDPHIPKVLIFASLNAPSMHHPSFWPLPGTHFPSTFACPH